MNSSKSTQRELKNFRLLLRMHMCSEWPNLLNTQLLLCISKLCSPWEVLCTRSHNVTTLRLACQSCAFTGCFKTAFGVHKQRIFFTPRETSLCAEGLKHSAHLWCGLYFRHWRQHYSCFFFNSMVCPRILVHSCNQINRHKMPGFVLHALCGD